jgi:hypothetical protein
VLIPRALFLAACCGAVATSGLTSSDSDVQAWINAVGSGNTNQTEVTNFTTMATTIKSALGISALNQKYDRLWVRGFCQVAAAGAVDLANRRTLTPGAVAPTFTPQKGDTGDGSSSYLKLGYTPSTDAVNFGQNSGHIFLYIQTMDMRSTSFYRQFGASGTGLTNEFLDKNTGTTQMVWGINNSNNGTTTTTTAQSAGRWALERTGGSSGQLYYNESQVGTTAVASGALGAREIYALCDNNAQSGAAFFTQSTIAVIAIASSLGTTGVANVGAAIHACGNAINATNFP